MHARRVEAFRLSAKAEGSQASLFCTSLIAFILHPGIMAS